MEMHRHPKHYKLLPKLMVTFQNLVLRSIAEYTTCLSQSMEETKLILIWNLHSYWLAFTVLEGSMQLTREENNDQFLPNYKP